MKLQEEFDQKENQLRERLLAEEKARLEAERRNSRKRGNGGGGGQKPKKPKVSSGAGSSAKGSKSSAKSKAPSPPKQTSSKAGITSGSVGGESPVDPSPPVTPVTVATVGTTSDGGDTPVAVPVDEYPTHGEDEEPVLERIGPVSKAAQRRMPTVRDGFYELVVRFKGEQDCEMAMHNLWADYPQQMKDYVQKMRRRHPKCKVYQHGIWDEPTGPCGSVGSLFVGQEVGKYFVIHRNGWTEDGLSASDVKALQGGAEMLEALQKEEEC